MSDFDPSSFRTKEACKINNEQIRKEIKIIREEVSELSKSNTELKVSDGKQTIVLEHLSRSIDTLNGLMGTLKEHLTIVDKEQTVNTQINRQATKFNLDLNWKTVSVLGIIGMSIINMILGKI